MKLKKLASLALAGALTLGLLPALSAPALATGGDTNTYTIDIPSALTVTKTGWNDQTAGIKASGTLADGKKLTVTATSPTNNFNLKSGGNSVAYKLAAESEKEKSYSDATATTTWEFSKDDLAASGGKTETVGVILEDITNKPAGTYTDTVTFTAKVENSTVLSGALVDGATIKVSFKWRGSNAGDYVQGTYSASSGTFTVSKGGSNWGRDERRAVYKVEKSGNNITIGAGLYDYDFEGMQWTFNAASDTYTYTPGDRAKDRPNEFGLISVTLNGTDITSQLTKNE